MHIAEAWKNPGYILEEKPFENGNEHSSGAILGQIPSGFPEESLEQILEQLLVGTAKGNLGESSRKFSSTFF